MLIVLCLNLTAYLATEQHPPSASFDAIAVPASSNTVDSNATDSSISFDMFPQDLGMAENYISQYIAQSTNDFLLQCNYNDLFDLGVDFLGQVY